MTANDVNNDGWGCLAQAALFALYLWGMQCCASSRHETEQIQRLENKVRALEQELHQAGTRISPLVQEQQRAATSR